MPLILLHDRDALVLWPLSQIAMLREEWDGRLEATLPDGRVLHRPGPLSTFLHPVLFEIPSGVLVNPEFVDVHSDELRLPGGWLLPKVDLPPSRQVERPAETLLAVTTGADGKPVWVTPEGHLPGPATREEALSRCPDLLPAGPHLVRPGALRRLSRQKGVGTLELEGGHELEVPRVHLPLLFRALGLPWPDSLADVPPAHRRVYELGLRDWPEDLLRWSDAELQRTYGSNPTMLVDHVIWEAYRRHSRHPEDGGATEHRGLFYNPLRVLASRAGILERPDPAELLSESSLLQLLQSSLPRPELAAATDSEGRLSDDRLWLRLQLRLDLFVGEWRLFTYEELGFVDAGASNREIGHARPHVVLLVEKSSLQRIARLVARRFGVSLLILGGVPTWIGTEFFCRELRARVSTPLLLVSFCDFDPYGWRFPKDFSRQVQRYGMSIQGILRLVTPSCFTAEEIKRYACDLPASPNQRKQIQEWLDESGGINGEAKGLYADYLRPAERVVAAFERETGLSAVLP